MLLCLNYSYGQFVLDFCATVDQNGYCVFNNNRFILSPDSTTERICMEIRNPETFKGISKVAIKIYSIEKDGEEKYENVMEQSVQDDWVYCWTPYVLKSVGKYHVKVYNGKEELICSKNLELLK